MWPGCSLLDLPVTRVVASEPSTGAISAPRSAVPEGPPGGTPSSTEGLGWRRGPRGSRCGQHGTFSNSMQCSAKAGFPCQSYVEPQLLEEREVGRAESVWMPLESPVSSDMDGCEAGSPRGQQSLCRVTALTLGSPHGHVHLSVP